MGRRGYGVDYVDRNREERNEEKRKWGGRDMVMQRMERG